MALFLVLSVCFRRKVLFERLAPDGRSPRYREHAHGVLCKLCRQVHSKHETQGGLGARQPSVPTASLGRAHGPQVPDGPEGDRPKDQRATIPKNGGHQPDDWQAACSFTRPFSPGAGLTFMVSEGRSGSGGTWVCLLLFWRGARVGFRISDLSSAPASPFSVRSGSLEVCAGEAATTSYSLKAQVYWTRGLTTRVSTTVVHSGSHKLAENSDRVESETTRAAILSDGGVP